MSEEDEIMMIILMKNATSGANALFFSIIIIIIMSKIMMMMMILSLLPLWNHHHPLHLMMIVSFQRFLKYMFVCFKETKVKFIIEYPTVVFCSVMDHTDRQTEIKHTDRERNL